MGLLLFYIIIIFIAIFVNSNSSYYLQPFEYYPPDNLKIVVWFLRKSPGCKKLITHFSDNLFSYFCVYSIDLIVFFSIFRCSKGTKIEEAL